MLETSDDLRPVVSAYLSNRAWDPDGGLSPEVVTETLQFFVRTGSLAAERAPSTLVDRTFLERALTTLALAERR